jgi:hypothetical protein
MYIYGKTRAEVVKKLRTAQIKQEKQILATGPRQTVKQYLEYWLQVKEETATVRKIFETCFSRAGFSVASFSDGRENKCTKSSLERVWESDEEQNLIHCEV